jgi:hypothetical protein
MSIRAAEFSCKHYLSSCRYFVVDNTMMMDRYRNEA